MRKVSNSTCKMPAKWVRVRVRVMVRVRVRVRVRVKVWDRMPAKWVDWSSPEGDSSILRGRT